MFQNVLIRNIAVVQNVSMETICDNVLRNKTIMLKYGATKLIPVIFL